ncbi:Iron-sulfur clusters transporter atm1, mitochondrial [Blastocladiella emersonii ATCC 22665]|nr:Iron-sulfur clusters transporter atm1, mitochondrial [Blastocladiella emersonii ATCC 22665]
MLSTLATPNRSVLASVPLASSFSTLARPVAAARSAECVPAVAAWSATARSPLVPAAVRNHSTSSSTPAAAPATKKPATPATKTDETGLALNVASDKEADMAILKNLVQYLWPRDDWSVRARVLIALSLLIAGKLLNVQVPYYFKAAVDSLTALTAAGSANTVANDLSVMAVCGTVLLGYGAARVGATLFSELRSAVFGAVAQRAIRRVARNIFDHLLRQDVSFHLARQTGALTRAIDRGTKGIAFVLSSMVFHVVPTALEISLVCGILAHTYGSGYAAVTAATLFLYTWFTVSTTTWRTRFRREMNAADNAAAARAVDSLVNIEAVKYFGGAPRETAEYDKSLAQYEVAAVKTTTSLAMLNAGQAGIFAVSLTAMMWMATQGVLAGALTVGDLVMINGLVFQLSMPLNFLGSVYREQRQALTDMQTMFALQSVQAAVRDKPDAKPLVWRDGVVTFDNVRFAYTPDREILRGVDLTLYPGEKVAFVGSSGSGKSSALRLLFRQYDPTAGRVLIDGQPLTDVTSESLLRHLSIVPQDTALFNNTIAYNIAYGRENATQEEIVAAAKRAQIHDRILEFPLGYNTRVGERGSLLSGGERQRVALARALIRTDARILALDESSAALDSRSEAAVLAAIDDFLHHPADPTQPPPMAIFVAHRLTTVAGCSRIFVLREGRVVEMGNHAELLAIPGGLYREMWYTQQQQADEAMAAAEEEPVTVVAPAGTARVVDV